MSDDGRGVLGKETWVFSWLSLAEAQWKAGDTVEAEETAREILSRSWGEDQEEVYDRAREVLDR